MAESAPAAAPEPNPWDQRPDESPEAYARFLSYRNLGPGRSLPLAEWTHGGARKSKKKHASGNWCEDAVKHEWASRAGAWDVHTIREQGAELSRLWLGILVSAARKSAEALADPAVKPRDFAQAVSVIDRLSPYMTPDVLKALQPAGPAARAGTGDPTGVPDPASVQ